MPSDPTGGPPADPPIASREALTYASYLSIDELLALQRPESAEHDELLFIVIHQVYELWFRQMLHELDAVVRALDADDAPRARKGLERVLAILKTVVAQVDVLETMTPLEFASFRDRLGSASGFQSRQFREIEFLLGRRRSETIERFRAAGIDPGPLERRLAEPSLPDALFAHLERAGLEGSPLDRLEAAYRARPGLADLCERVLDLDEGMLEWRYRHVRMVERTIGTKPGTGGSPGAAYLRSTMEPFVPELWEVRTRF